MPPFIFLFTPDGEIYIKLDTTKRGTREKYQKAIREWRDIRRGKRVWTLNYRAYRAAHHDRLVNSIADSEEKAREPWRQGTIKEE